MEKTKKESKSILFLSGFILKIIAIIAMTIDHLSQIMKAMYPYGTNAGIDTFYVVGKTIGRIALPLFCFLIVEGMIHTKNKKRYLFRLGIMAAIISIILLICYFLPIKDIRVLTASGNIFLDLFLGALMLYLIMRPNKEVRAFIPLILLYAIGSFAVKCYEFNSKAIVYIIPDFLRMQYDWFSILLILGFYFSYIFANAYYANQKEVTGLDVDFWQGTKQYRIATNLISFGILIAITLIYFLFAKLSTGIAFYDANISSAAMLAGFIILFYNGKRGYNAKWFQYGCYIYYPLHIGLLLLIFGLIWLI